MTQLTALTAYDNERPRSSSAVTSRSGLMRGLRIERLVKRHQEKNEPLPSLLYMVTSHLATRESTRTSPIKREKQPSTGGRSRSAAAAAAGRRARTCTGCDISGHGTDAAASRWWVRGSDDGEHRIRLRAAKTR